MTGRRAAWASSLAALLPLCLGCSLTLPPTLPASPAVSSAPTPVLPVASNAATASLELDATPAPSPYDPTRITQLCESWGGGAGDRLISCGRGLKSALESLGAGAADVERVYLQYKPRCDPVSPTCPARREDHAWVAIQSRPAGDLVVEVSLARDGGYVTTLPVRDASPPDVPTFETPRRAIARIAGPQPNEVRDRDPLPLCGVETADLGGPWQTDARRCFRDRVLAAQAVEFVSQARGTEGEAVLTIYRFTGQGAVRRYDREAGAWTSTACGLALLRTEVVFVTDGICIRRALDVDP